MKSIEKIIENSGVSFTEEQKKEMVAAVNENYRTIEDYNKQKIKLTTAEENVKTLTASLEKFNGVDVDKLNDTITQLKADVKKANDDANAKIADMAFDGLLTTAIAAAKGKDADIIKKNLDITALKASKNQSEDIKKALEAMASNELTKAWFGSPEPPQIGIGTFPGMLGINNNINTNNYLDEQYKGNPYYHPAK